MFRFGENKKESYIGSTYDFGKRYNEHLVMLNKQHHHSQHFQNAYNKYGKDNLKFDIIEECQEIPTGKLERANFLESKELLWYNLFKPVYNIMTPGDKITKIREKVSPDRLYCKSRKEVYLTTKNGSPIQKFKGVREASRILNIDSSSISSCARLLQNNTEGNYFRYKYNLYKEFITEKKSSPLLGKNKYYNRKSILCYNLKGDFIKEYEGIVEASTQLNLTESGISRCCSGEMKYTGDYTFRFKEDPRRLNIISQKKKNKYLISCYNNEQFIGECTTCTEASKLTGVSRQNIHAVITGMVKHSQKTNMYNFKVKSI